MARKSRLLTWLPIAISGIALTFSGISTLLSYAVYKNAEENLSVARVGETTVSAPIGGFSFEMRYRISNLSQRSAVLTNITCFSGASFSCGFVDDASGELPIYPSKLEPGDSKILRVNITKLPGGEALVLYHLALMWMKKIDKTEAMNKLESIYKLPTFLDPPKDVTIGRDHVSLIMKTLDYFGYSYTGEKLEEVSADKERVLYLSNFPCHAEFAASRVGVCFEILVHTAKGRQFTSGNVMEGIMFGDEAVHQAEYWKGVRPGDHSPW